MENFGPYREPAVIDFDAMGPVFLVWGKTGSGKTSIFDAMTYALYGGVAGSRSGLERQLWSQHAKPGDKPRVEFEFDLGGETWKVERIAPHRKTIRNGEERDAPAEAICRRLDGGQWTPVADRIGEVDAEMESRLGLSLDEFSKIVLLPQGEFQRFLEMDSSDRVGILEKLFPVDLHDAVTELARQKARAAAEELKRVEAELGRLRGEAAAAGLAMDGESGAGDRKALAAAAAEGEAALGAALAALVAAENAQARGRDDGKRALNAKAARERLAALEAGAAGAAERRGRLETARKAAAILPDIEAAQRADAVLAAERATLARREAGLAALRGGAAAAEERRAEASAADLERAGIDRELGELERALEAWRKAAAAEASLVTARAAVAGLEERLAGAAAAEAAALDAANAAALAPDEEEAVSRSWQEANVAFEAAKAREALAIRVDGLGREATVLGKEAKAAQDAATLADAAFSAFRAGRDREAAAMLAAELAPGEPCPVCGSRDHPAPALTGTAQAQDGGASPPGHGAEEGRRLGAERDAALARLASVTAALGAKGADLEAALGELRALAGADVPAEGARADRERAAAAAGAAAERFRGLGEKRRAFAAATEAHEAARRHREGIEKALAEARSRLAAVEAEAAATMAHSGGSDPTPRIAGLRVRRETVEAAGRAATAAAEAWNRELGKAEALVAESRGRLPSLEEGALLAGRAAETALAESGFRDGAEVREAAIDKRALAELERAVAAFDTELAGARVAAAEAERALVSAAIPDLAALAAAVETARTGHEEARRRSDSAREALSLYDRIAADIERCTAGSLELDARSRRLGTLSALLSGELGGRRLPFKNYVLGLYFREVIAGASIRLGQMTDSRYGLAAAEAPASGRGRTGLDLQVLDSYTGRARACGTLSGGERFLTSLALALALSDTIRKRSGGASLDAVFIDEGFGSLDEEALDRAVSALDKARGARMIGIISHVPELRSRIPSRIEVEKGRKGSRLSII
jgi:exonuclease SbcC